MTQEGETVGYEEKRLPKRRDILSEVGECDERAGALRPVTRRDLFIGH
jgi:hypothetical protein